MRPRNGLDSDGSYKDSSKKEAPTENNVELSANLGFYPSIAERTRKSNKVKKVIYVGEDNPSIDGGEVIEISIEEKSDNEDSVVDTIIVNPNDMVPDNALSNNQTNARKKRKRKDDDTEDLTTQKPPKLPRLVDAMEVTHTSMNTFPVDFFASAEDPTDNVAVIVKHLLASAKTFPAYLQASFKTLLNTLDHVLSEQENIASYGFLMANPELSNHIIQMTNSKSKENDAYLLLKLIYRNGSLMFLKWFTSYHLKNVALLDKLITEISTGAQKYNYRDKILVLNAYSRELKVKDLQSDIAYLQSENQRLDAELSTSFNRARLFSQSQYITSSANNPVRKFC